MNLMKKTICRQCNNEMIFKFSNFSPKQILLYCENCFSYNDI